LSTTIFPVYCYLPHQIAICLPLSLQLIITCHTRLQFVLHFLNSLLLPTTPHRHLSNTVFTQLIITCHTTLSFVLHHLSSSWLSATTHRHLLITTWSFFSKRLYNNCIVLHSPPSSKFTTETYCNLYFTTFIEQSSVTLFFAIHNLLKFTARSSCFFFFFSFVSAMVQSKSV